MNIETRHVRLFLVDDNPAVLREVIQLLPAEFEVVKTLQDGNGLSTAAIEERPDLIVLDITLPGANGIVLASRLASVGCTAKILFLTVHADHDYVRAALDVGASGYVVKGRLSSDFVPALQAILEGRRFISPFPELDDVDDVI